MLVSFAWKMVFFTFHKFKLNTPHTKTNPYHRRYIKSKQFKWWAPQAKKILNRPHDCWPVSGVRSCRREKSGVLGWRGWVSPRSAKIHYLWGDLDKRFDLFIVLQQCRRNRKFHFFLRERGGQISLVIWPPKDVRNSDCINDTELQQTPPPPTDWRFCVRHRTLASV